MSKLAKGLSEAFKIAAGVATALTDGDSTLGYQSAAHLLEKARLRKELKQAKN